MRAPQPTTVDVRDMLCAQALAVVAQAVGRVKAGEAMTILYSAEDVKHDLLVWTQARGHHAVAVEQTVLRLVKG